MQGSKGLRRGEVKAKGQVTGNFDKLCIQFELLCKDNKSVKAHLNAAKKEVKTDKCIDPDNNRPDQRASYAVTSSYRPKGRTSKQFKDKAKLGRLNDTD
jgi:hypothetical protein